MLPPPSLDICDIEDSCSPPKPLKRLSIGEQELLLIGLILLIVSDKCETDIPLVIALAYILFWK